MLISLSLCIPYFLLYTHFWDYERESGLKFLWSQIAQNKSNLNPRFPFCNDPRPKNNLPTFRIIDSIQTANLWKFMASRISYSCHNSVACLNWTRRHNPPSIFSTSFADEVVGSWWLKKLGNFPGILTKLKNLDSLKLIASY